MNPTTANIGTTHLTGETQVKEAGGFRISLLAKGILVGLTVMAAGAAITSAVLFFYMAIPIAMVALIASSIAFALLGLTLLYPAIEKCMPSPIQAVVNGVSSIAKELLFVPIVIALMIKQGIFGKKEEVAGGDNVVLMIHGYVGTSAHFNYLQYRLEKNEIGSVYTVDFGNPFLSIDDYVKKVEEKVAEIQKANPGKQITLVGHSMGGVVASRYVSQQQNISHLKKVITLGSPLQGTYMTKIAPGECARQMDRNSPFLTQIDQDLQGKTAPFVNVGSTTDLIIVPNSATSFATVTQYRKKVTMPGMGHATYLFSDKIVSLLLQEIRGV